MARNPEKVRAAKRRYNQKPEVKARRATYDSKNREHLRARRRAWSARPEAQAKKQAYAQSRKALTAAYARAYHLAKNYGLTVDQFEQLQIQHGRCCAICGTPEEQVAGRWGGLKVDHDHETGRVRGLLCHHCNVMLGNARDRTEILLKAVEYLRERR